MADSFDAVDIAYDKIENCGLPVYKDKAPDDVVSGKKTHVVINTLNFIPGDVIGQVPVNINIYVPKTTNGMINRAAIKTHRTTINTAIKNASMPEGMYYELSKEFEALIKDLSNGFDMYNIRYNCYLTN